jgi:peptidoglycan-N-acetylglucosamine deacetylase
VRRVPDRLRRRAISLVAAGPKFRDTPPDLLRPGWQFQHHGAHRLDGVMGPDIEATNPHRTHGDLLGEAMADRPPYDNIRPVSFVNRRRVLLAVGGMALTSVTVPRLGGSPSPSPALAAEHQTLTPRHGAGRPHPHPHRPRYALNKPLYYVDDASKSIALTIDDGPDPVYTPQILRLLHRYQITATFSMIGLHVAAFPHLARDVHEAGHKICNHTWNHADLAGFAAHRVHDEITRASHAIHAATGVHPHLFRAPYGAWSREVIRECQATRMIPLDWSVDPRDWSMPGVRKIVRNIMKNTQPGSIILEHDGGGNRSETVKALRIVLPRLLDQGYSFRTP